MADELFLKGEEGEMKAVSSAPSMNKTPVGNSEPPLPYPVTATLQDAVDCSRNVFLNGKPAYLLNRSAVTKSTGDSAGSSKGVRKGTVNGQVKATMASSTVRVNGEPPVRIGDTCTMQGGETVGRFVMAPPPALFKQQPGAPVPSSEAPPSRADQAYQQRVQELEDEMNRLGSSGQEDRYLAALRKWRDTKANEPGFKEAYEKLEEIKAQDARELFNPKAREVRRTAELKEKLARPRPNADLPVMTDGSKPRESGLNNLQHSEISNI